MALTTVHVSNLVAHGVAHELLRGVVHDKHVFHTQHLGGGHFAGRFVMGTALVGDGLPPLVLLVLRGAVL